MILADVSQNPWNSLEVVKLAVGILTPFTVIAVGFWINRRLKGVEHLQWANQKVIERRLEVFDDLAPQLNDLLCYFSFIGCWKELEPPKVVEMKRKVDRVAYVNATLFPDGFLELYNSFIHSCYSTYSGWGEDAKLMTLTQRRKEAAGDSWKSEWDDLFDEKAAIDPNEIGKRYRYLMAFFASELGIELTKHAVRTGQVPGNII